MEWVFTQKCIYDSNAGATWLQYYYDSDNNDNFTGFKQDILDENLLGAT